MSGGADNFLRILYSAEKYMIPTPTAASFNSSCNVYRTVFGTGKVKTTVEPIWKSTEIPSMTWSFPQPLHTPYFHYFLPEFRQNVTLPLPQLALPLFILIPVLFHQTLAKS